MSSIRSRVLGILILSALVVAGVHSVHARTEVPSLRQSQREAVKSKPMKGSTLNRFQEKALRDFLAGQTAILDTLYVGVIQHQFSDSLMGGQEGSRRPELHDSTYFANELTHLYEYYDSASRGRTVVAWELCGELYTMPKEMGYYGDDVLQDERVVEMMEEVIAQSDDVVDFSKYHTVMLIHAGAGQETDLDDNSREQLFSVFMDLGDIQAAFPDSMVEGLITNDTVDGEPFYVDNFMVLPEAANQDGVDIGSLGIWAFVTGSRYGLLPLFDDTPSGFVDSRGVGDFCLMSYGLFAGPLLDRPGGGGYVPVFPCVFNRLIAGWVDPLTIEADGSYDVRDLNRPAAGDTGVHKDPDHGERVFPGREPGARQQTSIVSLRLSTATPTISPDNTDSLKDAEFDFYLTLFTNPFEFKPDPIVGDTTIMYNETGSGMYVWHIDESVIRQTIDMGSLPNDFASRKGVDLEEADGIQDLDSNSGVFSFGSHFDSFREGNNTAFTPGSKPSSEANSFAPTGVMVTGISDVGRYMSFDFAVSRSFDETRTRWQGASRFQPPAAFDFGNNAALEVIALSDTLGVFVFNDDGTEFFDGDLGSDGRSIRSFLFRMLFGVERRPSAMSTAARRDILAAATDGRLYLLETSAIVTELRAARPFAAPPAAGQRGRGPRARDRRARTRR